LTLLRTFHAAELPYVWDTFEALAYVPFPWERDLSKLMQGYWGTFATTGNPNFGAAPYWPTYDPTMDVAIQLDTPLSSIQGIESAQCDFLDAHVPFGS
jgi:para-nitrobenzyl esterase